MSGDHGLDPHSEKVIQGLDLWAERLASPDGPLGREVEYVPDAVAVMGALHLAARVAATRPDLFSRGTVEALLRQNLDETMPEGAVSA